MSDALVLLAWDASPDAAVTGYVVFRSPAEGPEAFAEIGRTGAAELNFFDSDVKGGSAYLYRVAATTEAGTGEPSETQRVEVPAGPDIARQTAAPTVPTITGFSGQTYDSITVTWSAPDAAEAVTDYDVQWRRADDETDEGWSDDVYDGTVVDDTINVFTIGNLDYDTSYDVRVLARNAAGPSEWATHTGNNRSKTNRRKPDLDITLTTGGNPQSIWSDGATMWVADGIQCGPCL